jgi:hypothetical protein
MGASIFALFAGIEAPIFFHRSVRARRKQVNRRARLESTPVALVLPGRRTHERKKEFKMASTPKSLSDAMNEVQRAAHDQDLVEVPKRAQLEREAEQAMAVHPLVFPKPISVPETK